MEIQPCGDLKIQISTPERASAEPRISRSHGQDVERTADGGGTFVFHLSTHNDNLQLCLGNWNLCFDVYIKLSPPTIKLLPCVWKLKLKPNFESILQSVEVWRTWRSGEHGVLSK
eukprot:TRINITY_DN12769_c0_g1_i4.p1 TRINITY_DN12769_c0_g1~~TRINITY_DN12769_c0_g1_i4.p1  ORF type:complete len:115 (-),score=15.10 TRINITY_DN12769_c0_g1_i4:12-356(-)